MKWSVRQDAAWLFSVVASVMMLCDGCAQWSPRSAKHPLLGERVQWPAESGLGLSSVPPPKCTALLFWSPGCSGCKKWLSLLDRFQRQANSNSVIGVVVFGGREDVNRVIREYGIRMRQVHDLDGTWFAKLKIEVVPRLVLIDSSEHLIYASPDEADASVIEGVFWRCAAYLDGAGRQG